jgi:hypothetical protein
MMKATIPALSSVKTTNKEVSMYLKIRRIDMNVTIAEAKRWREDINRCLDEMANTFDEIQHKLEDVHNKPNRTPEDLALEEILQEMFSDACSIEFNLGKMIQDSWDITELLYTIAD